MLFLVTVKEDSSLNDWSQKGTSMRRIQGLFLGKLWTWSGICIPKRFLTGIWNLRTFSWILRSPWKSKSLTLGFLTSGKITWTRKWLSKRRTNLLELLTTSPLRYYNLIMTNDATYGQSVCSYTFWPPQHPHLMDKMTKK